MAAGDANGMTIGLEKKLAPRRFRAGQVAAIGGLGLLLLSAIAFQGFYRLRETPQAVPRVRLAAVLPRSLAGWKVDDQPLGQTEAVNTAALKALNLDDYVYREFRKGEKWFTIYAAFWAAGRMPTRLVASHTPDRCWTENGMRCVVARFREDYTVNDRKLLPAEYRVFTAASGGSETYVFFWHTVEGKIYDYGARFSAIPEPWLWWKDTVTQAAYGSREQLFVRIASNTGIGDLWKDGDFREVMAVVGRMGLFAN